MRTLFFIAAAMLLLQHLSAQGNLDSLDKQLKAAPTDSARNIMMRTFARRIVQLQPDTAVSQLLRLKTHFELTKNREGIGWTLGCLSLALGNTGDYEQATTIGLQSLKIFEPLNDTTGIMYGLTAIGIAIAQNGDVATALTYFKKIAAYNSIIKDQRSILNSNNNMADCYIKLNKPDSALSCLAVAMDCANKSNDPYGNGIVSGTYGQYYMATKEYDLALSYLKRAFTNLLKAGDFFDQANCYNSMATIYFSQQQYDSSRYYAYTAVNLAMKNNFNQPLVDGYEMLYKNYEQANNNDSAFKYLKLQLATKDSLFNEEKQKKVQSLAFAEQIREQEAETKETMAAEKHKENIETAAIGAGILTFIILFLLYSTSIIASPRLINFLGVITLIVTFEFLYLVLDRYIVAYTHDSTLLMLLAWVVLAAVLSPLDEFMNRWVKHRLVEKNKLIKIKAAHKVLDTLEGGKS